MACLFKERVRSYLFSIATDKRTDFFSGTLRVFLLFLSFIYAIILKARFFYYQTGKSSIIFDKVKVISVGNITLGGTGKTPLVELIVEYLISRESKVAVISRGYMGIKAQTGFLADEPEMLRNVFPHVPIIVNKNRVLGIQAAQGKYGAECVVLDDAFGNLKISKNLDIVCLDCRNPFGNGFLLPRGILRLPLLYLKKADIFILTHFSAGNNNIDMTIKTLRKFNEKALIFKSRHVPEFFYDLRNKNKEKLSLIEGTSVALVCGIANPEGLKQTLKDLKAQIISGFYFPDHHPYAQEELDNIFQDCRNNKVTTLITTAKDEPRLKPILTDRYPEFKILVLKIKLQIIEEDEERFLEFLSTISTA